MASFYFYLRSLRPGGVLLKLTVMNGEVRPEITAVTQRSNAAAEGEKNIKTFSNIFKLECLLDLLTNKKKKKKKVNVSLNI